MKMGLQDQFIPFLNDLMCTTVILLLNVKKKKYYGSDMIMDKEGKINHHKPVIFKLF